MLSLISSTSRVWPPSCPKTWGAVSLPTALRRHHMNHARAMQHASNAHGRRYLRPLRTWLVGIAVLGLLVTAAAPATFADTVFSVSGNFGNGAFFNPGSTVTIDTTLGILTD